ncbi:hypothetical protein [Streptomyces sp. LaPpAH-108]|uniref:DUF7878 domain-containing protein n=1 Tax=Streptomyces sp. LaPpAH-108 TaxID=1155714 RepID=UPI0003790E29|nr:hypothetical protein [Streptomyces sp. LaPpAH-108]
MTVGFAYRGLGARDLPRRGLTLRTAPAYVLLVDLEADFVVLDGERVVMEEGLFPVAELARELVFWLRAGEEACGDFAFDSMSYDEVGAVRIVHGDDGWRVGGVYDPGVWSAPVEWDVLVRAVRGFVDGVREDIAAMGVGPGLVPLG